MISPVPMLYLQSPVRASKPRIVVAQTFSAKGAPSVTQFALSGKFILLSRQESQTNGLLVPKKANWELWPSPGGASVLSTGTLHESGKSYVCIWTTTPIRRTVYREFPFILRRFWLHGREAIGVIEKTASGPSAWVIDANSGKAVGPMPNTLSLVDKPGSRTVMRVRSRMDPAVSLSLLSPFSQSSISRLTKEGKLVFEESADLKSWRRITGLAAAREWVWKDSKTVEDCSWIIGRRPMGFRDNWLVRSSKSHPVSGQPDTHWMEQDDLFSNRRRVAWFVRPTSYGGVTIFGLSQFGEATLSMPPYADVSLEQWLNGEHRYENLDAPKGQAIAAVKYSPSSVNRWLIAGLPKCDLKVVLWR